MKPKSTSIRRLTERLFVVAFLACVTIALAALAVLLASIVGRAWPYLSPGLFVKYANYHDPAAAGYAAAIVGTLWIMGLTLLFALPVGMAAGIYLEEYGRPGRILRLLQAAVTNLAGVPSVVFGLLGLAVFVRALRPITDGSTVLAGALTLTILIFPYVVTTTQEAIRAVPPSIRDASLALGATKWQTIRRQVLPAAGPGLLTGTILMASRVMGETAPLIVIGAVALMTYLPSGPRSVFVALPVQIYAYVGLPGSAFQGIAAAGMVILLVLLFGFNSIAIVARNRMQRRMW